MLPTPSTDHVPFTHIYEPSTDSYLLLDTLSSPSQKAFLSSLFPSSAPTPLILELGTGSGIVLSFLTANARAIFNHPHILTLGVDLNPHACTSTAKTVALACHDAAHGDYGFYGGNILNDLMGCLRAGQVDVLVFNPPYVPTETLPDTALPDSSVVPSSQQTFEEESRLLALSYAGGTEGMEITNRFLEVLPGLLSPRGCAYLLLCAQNRPLEVKARIEGWEGGWSAEIVGESGGKGGWERLTVLRIGRAD